MIIPEIDSIWVFKPSNPDHPKHNPKMTYRLAQITTVDKAYNTYQVCYRLINQDGSHTSMRSYLSDFLEIYSPDLDQREYIL